MGWHDFLSCPEESFIFNSVTYLALVSSLITKQYTNKFLAVEHRDSWKLSFFFFFFKSQKDFWLCAWWGTKNGQHLRLWAVH